MIGVENGMSNFMVHRTDGKFHFSPRVFYWGKESAWEQGQLGDTVTKIDLLPNMVSPCERVGSGDKIILDGGLGIRLME